MKKILITIIVIFLSIFIFNIKETTNSVMDYNDNIDNIYLLDFSNEVLSTYNFKLKIAPFTGYAYIIRKIYPKYNRNLKKYYTYNFRNLDDGIDKFKSDYINLLRENELDDEIDKVYKTGIIISKVEIYTTKDALNKFLKKYPNVKYKILSPNYNEV